MRRASTLIVLASALGACHSHSGSSADGGSDSGFVAGAPITATPETWTWVPFADSFCADGSNAGIGVNLSTKSTRAIIYLEGGGACWDMLTCYTLMTAAYFTTGYSQSDFMTESSDATYLALPGGFFDRTAAANPFKDYSYVYVPYCTGDNHSGNNVAHYGSMTAMHVGFKNLTAYLQRLVPTFASADRVYLAGSSAGGFGAAYNWWQAQQAFGAVRVDLVDDSGTFLPADVLAMGSGATNAAAQSASWNLPATRPPGCTACANGLDALYAFYAGAFADHHGALLSYQMDTTLPSFYGISSAQFQTGLTEVTSMDLDPHPSLRYFLVGAAGHVLFFNPTLAEKSVALQTWLTQMVTDDPSWANDSP